MFLYRVWSVGGGVCVSEEQKKLAAEQVAFCTSYDTDCTIYGGEYSDCMEEVAGMQVGTKNDKKGDSFSCRVYHLAASTILSNYNVCYSNYIVCFTNGPPQQSRFEMCFLRGPSTPRCKTCRIQN